MILDLKKIFGHFWWEGFNLALSRNWERMRCYANRYCSLGNLSLKWRQSQTVWMELYRVYKVTVHETRLFWLRARGECIMDVLSAGVRIRLYTPEVLWRHFEDATVWLSHATKFADKHNCTHAPSPARTLLFPCICCAVIFTILRNDHVVVFQLLFFRLSPVVF